MDIIASRLVPDLSGFSGGAAVRHLVDVKQGGFLLSLHPQFVFRSHIRISAQMAAMWDSGSGALGEQVGGASRPGLHLDALWNLNLNEHAPHSVQIGKWNTY